MGSSLDDTANNIGGIPKFAKLLDIYMKVINISTTNLSLLFLKYQLAIISIMFCSQ